jgi:hypothetical protein
MHLKLRHIGSLSLALAAAGLTPLAGCQRDPIVHRPVTTAGYAGDRNSIFVAGALWNQGHCELLEVQAVPEDFDDDDLEEHLALNIDIPDTARAWLETAMARSTVQLMADPWGSWVQMGSHFLLPELGVSVRGTRSGSTEICSGERFPRFDIAEVLGVYDIDEQIAYANPSNLLLSRDVYDLEDGDIQTVFQAGIAGQQGQHREMTIEVAGTWGEDAELELPPWELTDPEAGYIVLEYANAGVVPDEQVLLDALLADEGVRDFTRLSEDARQELLDEVYEETRGGEYTYTGYFTGEVRFNVGQRAVTATPVFMVTGLVPED